MKKENLSKAVEIHEELKALHDWSNEPKVSIAIRSSRRSNSYLKSLEDNDEFQNNNIINQLNVLQGVIQAAFVAALDDAITDLENELENL